MPIEQPDVPPLSYSFPVDPSPLRRWDLCSATERPITRPPPKNYEGRLAEYSPRETVMLKRKCDEAKKKKRPFWYLGDLQNPKIEKYDRSDYSFTTIYDRNLDRTLQPTKQKDWVDDLNIERESIVPGYSLLTRCYDYTLKECQEDPFIRDRKKWLDSVKEKLKTIPKDLPECEIYNLIYPAFCYDKFYGPEPEEPNEPIPDLPYEEWPGMRTCTPELRKPTFKPKEKRRIEIWKAPWERKRHRHENRLQPPSEVDWPTPDAVWKIKKQIVTSDANTGIVTDVFPCLKMYEIPLGFNWHDGVKYYPFGQEPIPYVKCLEGNNA